jgi:molecular chaperone GrpE
MSKKQTKSKENDQEQHEASPECETIVDQEQNENSSENENIIDLESIVLTEEDELKDEADAIQKKLEEADSKYLNLLAENENSRKRFVKERQSQEKIALKKVILEFLQPLDSFSRALGFTDHMSDEVKNWAVGFEMIQQQFRDVLVSYDVKTFSSKGEVFDAHKHEALEMVETSESKEGTIIEECFPGYLMGDKVIRPAKVKVAKAPAVSEELQEQENQHQENQK